jgi:metallopeptidase family M12-like protein
MTRSRRIASAALISLAALQAASPALAQAQDEGVPLIMMRTESTAAFGGERLRKLVAALKKRAGKSSRKVLPLTKAEIWTVPKQNVAAVQKEATRHGVVMSQLAAGWNQLLRRLPALPKVNGRQQSMIDLAKASAATLGVGMMTTPPPPMMEYALTDDADLPAASQRASTITVALNDSTVLTLRRTSVEVRADMCVWRGTVDGTGAPATLMWWPGGKTAGMVQHEGRLYSIRHMGGELHAVVEMADERMPREHAPMPERLRSDHPSLRDDPLVNQGEAESLRPVTAGPRAPAQKGPPQHPKAAAAGGGVVIDVIVAYTKKAASYYADVRRELIELAIEEGNHSFRMSGINNVTLRLVHAYETNYVEEGAHFDHVWRFADKGDGYMEEIHPLRDKYKADVAILIVDDPKGCGLATRVHADADEAFAVVHHECAASTYSLAHEIGHLIGARHELAMDKVMTPFPYGHGYVNGTKWRDIMSYKDSCGGCPRIPVWSSPKILIKGEPAGTPELDNARVIVEQAARVAAFR